MTQRVLGKWYTVLLQECSTRVVPNLGPAVPTREMCCLSVVIWQNINQAYLNKFRSTCLEHVLEEKYLGIVIDLELASQLNIEVKQPRCM